MYELLTITDFSALVVFYYLECDSLHIAFCDKLLIL